MQTAPAAADRLARRAGALAFATQGMVFISLTTRLPPVATIRRRVLPALHIEYVLTG